MEQEGNIKDPNSDEIIPCLITKSIIVEKNSILITINGNFKRLPEKEEMLKNILENIDIAVDIPFFFNGDTNKFTWESTGLDLIDKKENVLLDPYQYIGDNFKAYDETYDLNFEILASCDTGKIKIIKFPIIAYVHTDEGYKSIYQGINIVPQFKLDKTFEIQSNVHNEFTKSNSLLQEISNLTTIGLDVISIENYDNTFHLSSCVT